MKKIAWITPTAFLDTDIYVVPLLKNCFFIDWYIVKRENEEIDYADKINALSAELKIEIISLGQRYRSLSTFVRYFRLYASLKHKYDLIYTSMVNFPYHTPLLAITNGVNNCVMAIHNVHVPKGGINYYAMKAYTSFTIKVFKNFQTFSKGQYEELLRIAKNKNVMQGSFMLKDYGDPRIERNDNRITFLSFGLIRAYKRLDVLINAAEQVYNKYGNQFRVMITGGGADWEKYQKLIKHPEIFELRIERIPNEDIPDIFNQCDYFVTPYQDIAQSGSLVVAINYEKPVIASRLKAFEECIEDKQTGYLIEPASVEDLVHVMSYIIENHDSIYSGLVENIRRLKMERFSEDVVIKKYKEFFDEVFK